MIKINFIQLKILLLLYIIIFFTSCSNNHLYPKRVYMPDMYYSEAYEPYAEKVNLNKSKIPLLKNNYNMTSFYPVKNTISKHYINNNIINSRVEIVNNNILNKDIQEMYIINCAICHGENGDGLGLLVQNDKILGVPNYKNLNLNINNIYQVITYGKNNMGSYSSQINELDRWKIAKYVLYLKNLK